MSDSDEEDAIGPPKTITGMKNEERASAGPKEFHLGVLLVHGMGTQRSGQILTSWGDALVKTIEAATNERVEATVGPAQLSPRGEAGDRAEAVVTLRHGGDLERWLLSEGWWAEAFLAPSYSDLVSWSIRALPWAVALHVAQGHWRNVAGKQGLMRVGPAIIALPKLLLGLLLAPLAMVVLGATLLFGALPIPQLRSFIMAAQGALVSTVGDSLAFIESPIRAAFIRTRILERMKRLRDRCERTVVIAHSQGAAVVLESLGGIPSLSGHAGEAKAASDEPAPACVPDALLTFGAGTNQLASLKNPPIKAKEDDPGPVVVATLGLIAMLICSIWIYRKVLSNESSALDNLKAFGIQTGVILLGALLTWPMLGALERLARKRPFVRTHETKFVLAGVLVILAGTLLLLVALEKRFAPTAGSAVSFLWLAMFFLMASSMVILSKETERLVSKARRPPGLKRWIDVYASEDPVPNGPTRTNERRPDESIEIYNEGSFYTDHTTYWENLDGFVLRVARLCAETGRSRWVEDLPKGLRAAGVRAAWRVKWLRLARWAAGFSAALFGACLWRSYSPVLPSAVPIPSWIPPVLSRSIHAGVFVLAVIALGILLIKVLRGHWRSWSRAEQFAFLSGAPSTTANPVDLYILGALEAWMIVGAFALGARALNRSPLLPSFFEALFFAFVLVVWSLPLTWLLLRVVRAPVPVADNLPGKTVPDKPVQ